MRLLYILLSLIVAPLANALTVKSEAGQLHILVTDRETTDLTVTGSIDASDLDFINNSLDKLTTLDLGGAEIKAYRGAALASGRTSSPAATLPEYSLTGSTVTALTLPSGLKSIGEGALAGSALTSITLPEGVEEIGAYCLDGCRAMLTATLGNRLTAIPAGTFKGCTSLIEVTMPESVTAIGEESFNGCTALEGINFAGSLTAIGAGAFAGTAISDLSLTHCTHLNTIGDFAFSHCRALAGVELPNSVRELGEGAFFDCSALEYVTLPEGLQSLAPYLLKGTPITDATEVMREGVDSIGDYALYGASRVTEAQLPSTVSHIGERAMAGMTSLTRLDATNLDEMPTLGTDSFEGTASKDVTLLVKAGQAEVYEITPQWQEFTVIADNPSESGIISTDSRNEAVSMRLEGRTLHIITERPMDMVLIHGTAGEMLMSHSAGNSDRTALETDRMSGRTVIVTIIYADGLRSSMTIII